MYIIEIFLDMKNSQRVGLSFWDWLFAYQFRTMCPFLNDKILLECVCATDLLQNLSPANNKCYTVSC